VSPTDESRRAVDRPCVILVLGPPPPPVLFLFLLPSTLTPRPLSSTRERANIIPFPSLLTLTLQQLSRLRAHHLTSTTRQHQPTTRPVPRRAPKKRSFAPDQQQATAPCLTHHRTRHSRTRQHRGPTVTLLTGRTRDGFPSYPPHRYHKPGRPEAKSHERDAQRGPHANGSSSISINSCASLFALRFRGVSLQGEVSLLPVLSLSQNNVRS
jgi:hypothetical protein